jgi:hypothetical protein
MHELHPHCVTPDHVGVTVAMSLVHPTSGRVPDACGLRRLGPMGRPIACWRGRDAASDSPTSRPLWVR